MINFPHACILGMTESAGVDRSVTEVTGESTNANEQKVVRCSQDESSTALCSLEKVMHSVRGNMHISHPAECCRECPVNTPKDQPAWLSSHTQTVIGQIWQTAARVWALWERMGLDQGAQEMRWRTFMCDCLSTFLSDFATVAEVEEGNCATENEQLLREIYCLCQFMHEMPQTAELSSIVRRMQYRAHGDLSSCGAVGMDSGNTGRDTIDGIVDGHGAWCDEHVDATNPTTPLAEGRSTKAATGSEDSHPDRVVSSSSISHAVVLCRTGDAPEAHTHDCPTESAWRPSALLRQWAQQVSHSHIHNCLQAEYDRLTRVAEERLSLLRLLARYRAFLLREHNDPSTRRTGSAPADMRASSSHRYTSALSTARPTSAESIRTPPTQQRTPPQHRQQHQPVDVEGLARESHTNTPHRMSSTTGAPSHTATTITSTSTTTSTAAAVTQAKPSASSHSVPRCGVASEAVHAARINPHDVESIVMSSPALSAHAPGECDSSAHPHRHTVRCAADGESSLRRSQKEELRLLLAAPLYEEAGGGHESQSSSSLCLRPRRTTWGHKPVHTHRDTGLRTSRVTHLHHSHTDPTSDNHHSNSYTTSHNRVHCSSDDAECHEGIHDTLSSGEEVDEAATSSLNECGARVVGEVCAGSTTATSAAEEAVVNRFGRRQDMSLARIGREVESLRWATHELNAAMTQDTDIGRHCIRALYRVIDEMEAERRCIAGGDAAGAGGRDFTKAGHDCIRSEGVGTVFPMPRLPCTLAEVEDHVSRLCREFDAHSLPSVQQPSGTWTHDATLVTDAPRWAHSPSAITAETIRATPSHPVSPAPPHGTCERAWVNLIAGVACRGALDKKSETITDTEKDSAAATAAAAAATTAVIDCVAHAESTGDRCMAARAWTTPRLSDEVRQLLVTRLATPARNWVRRVRAQLQLYVFFLLAWELQYVYEELRVVATLEKALRSSSSSCSSPMTNDAENVVPEAKRGSADTLSVLLSALQTKTRTEEDDMVWLSDVCGPEMSMLHRCTRHYLQRTAAAVRRHVLLRYKNHVKDNVSHATTTSCLEQDDDGTRIGNGTEASAYIATVQLIFADTYRTPVAGGSSTTHRRSSACHEGQTTACFASRGMPSSSQSCPRVAAALAEIAAPGHTASMFQLDQRRAAAIAMTQCARAELHTRHARLSILLRAEPLLRARDAILREEQAMRTGSRARLLSKRINMAKQLLHEEAVRRRIMKELPMLTQQLWSLVHAWDTIDDAQEKYHSRYTCAISSSCDGRDKTMSTGCSFVQRETAEQQRWDKAGSDRDGVSSHIHTSANADSSRAYSTHGNLIWRGTEEQRAEATAPHRRTCADRYHAREDRVLRVGGVDVKALLVAIPAVLAHPTRSWPAPPTHRVTAADGGEQCDQARHPQQGRRKMSAHPTSTTSHASVANSNSLEQRQRRVRSVSSMRWGAGRQRTPTMTSVSRSPVLSPSLSGRVYSRSGQKSLTPVRTITAASTRACAKTNTHSSTTTDPARAQHMHTTHTSADARIATTRLAASRTPLRARVRRDGSGSSSSCCCNAKEPSSPPSITQNVGRARGAARSHAIPRKVTLTHRAAPLRARSPLPSKPIPLTTTTAAKVPVTSFSCWTSWKRRRSTPTETAATLSHATHHTRGHDTRMGQKSALTSPLPHMTVSRYK